MHLGWDGWDVAAPYEWVNPLCLCDCSIIMVVYQMVVSWKRKCDYLIIMVLTCPLEINGANCSSGIHLKGTAKRMWSLGQQSHIISCGKPTARNLALGDGKHGNHKTVDFGDGGLLGLPPQHSRCLKFMILWVFIHHCMLQKNSTFRDLVGEIHKQIHQGPGFWINNETWSCGSPGWVIRWCRFYRIPCEHWVIHRRTLSIYVITSKAVLVLRNKMAVCDRLCRKKAGLSSKS